MSFVFMADVAHFYLRISRTMSWAARPFYTLTARERPTVGDTKFSAVNLDHMGWLKCDGRNVATSNQYFLFQVIGYSFGSNTSNDFNLPNMAGRVPGAIGLAGTNSNYYNSNWTLGQSTGTELHTLTVAEMPTHNHTGTTDAAGYSASFTSVQTPVTGTDVADDTGTHTHTFTTSNAGLSNAHNNMQPTTFIGNMFIYSGKTNYASFNFPYKLNTNLY
jgi:microcystin-dependent protein